MYQIWPDNGGGGGGGGGGRDVRPKKKAPAEQLRSRIQRILKTQIDSYRFRWRLLALLIGHRNSKLVQEELIANLDYWQERTGQRIDVICVGMGTSKSPRGGSSLASGVSWLETMSDWRFSGQTDIILLNARFDRTQRAVALDFSTVVSFCLEHGRRSYLGIQRSRGKAIGGQGAEGTAPLDPSQGIEGRRPTRILLPST